MHTRRISSFLLGAWVIGCVLTVFFYVRSLQSASMVLSSPPPTVATIVQLVGEESTAAFARHVAAEEMRHLFNNWEELEMILALVLGGCLFLATQRRIFPLVLCGMMLLLVFFQHFGLTPEISYRGREADFPPGSLNVGTMTRLVALQQVYFGVEVIKLLAGGILASYLFVFRTSRRTRRSADLVETADS